MCKVVTMLSKDTVEHLLLPRFCDLCSDARLFQVRKVRTTQAIIISRKHQDTVNGLRGLQGLTVQSALFHISVTQRLAIGVHGRCRVGPSLPRLALSTFVNITVGFGWVFLDLITPRASLYSVVHITTAVPALLSGNFPLS